MGTSFLTLSAKEGFSCEEMNFQWVCAFHVRPVPRRAILFSCHQLMGPPRQAAPNALLLPPATSIEHDVRMFSMLAAQALRARQ